MLMIDWLTSLRCSLMYMDSGPNLMSQKYLLRLAKLILSSKYVELARTVATEIGFSSQVALP